MTTKPITCEGCPLHSKGKGFVPDQRVTNPDYIIFGEAPGSAEISAGKPFQGKAGFVLKNWLIRQVPQLQLADEKRKVSYMNVLKCLPPEVQGRPYPKGQEKLDAERHCSQYMAPLDAETVVLCGESPQRYFFQDELAREDASDRSIKHDLKGVMGRVGRTYMRNGITYVFAPHPTYILRQPALVGHGVEALRIATKCETLMEPNYMAWNDAMQELL